MNPFRDVIVANPWETIRGDVPEIHQRVFEQCLRGIEYIRLTHQSAGLLIHGEAGSGKTHLLTRLRERLTPQAPSATGRDECLYVYVRLQTSPRMIWRTLRRTLVEDWFRPMAGGRPQIERILYHRLADIRVAEGDLELWYEYMLQEHPDGLQTLIEQIADSLNLDRNTTVAFTHIALGRHRRDLRAWLAGTSLPEAALARLDLVEAEGTDEDREDESRQVVTMLCRLAGNGLPIVLGFDQVEALETKPRDQEALFTFGQLISTLHSETTNVLLVSCVQSAFATELKAGARDADYARMSELGSLSLDPLNRAQAERLIAERLRPAVESSAPPVPQSSCWPLEQREFNDLFVNNSLTPRRLLWKCAEEFELWEHPVAEAVEAVTDGSTAPAPLPDPAAEFLAERWEVCLNQKLESNQPDQTDDIVRHSLPLLVKIVAPEARPVRDVELTDIPLIFERPSGRIGVSICTQSNMTSLAARLKRLQDQVALQRLKRVVIVRDDRLPITATAKAARQRLAELEELGCVVLYPKLEPLAGLDALRGLLSDAKSGDLACRGETVSPKAVEDWLADHLAAELRDFVEEILGLSQRGSLTPLDAREVETLLDLLSQKSVLSLEEGARALGCTADEIANIVLRHPEHFGLLGQPPTTLFRAIHATESSA